jgi:glycosyltransferase involved in cell wall biosynthesis
MTATTTGAGVVASQLGARMHYAVPRMLAADGRLAHCYTDICATKGWPRALRALPERWRPAALRRLTGRIPKDLPAERLTSFAGFGLRLVMKRRAARTPSDHTEAAIWGGERFSDLVNRRGFHGAGGVFGYNGECLEQLEAARAAGLWTAVEQTIAPFPIVQQLLQAEQDKHPGWQLPAADDRFADRFAAREHAEWAAATVILCGSEFVRAGIAACGGPTERCVVVPYGLDARFDMTERPRHGGPLRVLTVGGIGLRKGSPYVAAAAQRLRGQAVFRMVGPCDLLPAARAALADAVELVGPVPRADILAHYRWADVFLLPSVCEGSATVTYEALAAHLPVICTPNTGSVVRDGIDGFIVPVGSTDAIVERLAFLREDPDCLRALGREAGRRARAFTLEQYRERLRAALPGGGRA